MLKITWLDSQSRPSKLHITSDGGISTLCGQRPLERHLKDIYKITNLTNTQRCSVCHMAMHKKKIRSAPYWYSPEHELIKR